MSVWGPYSSISKGKCLFWVTQPGPARIWIISASVSGSLFFQSGIFCFQSRLKKALLFIWQDITPLTFLWFPMILMIIYDHLWSLSFLIMFMTLWSLLYLWSFMIFTIPMIIHDHLYWSFILIHHCLWSFMIIHDHSLWLYNISNGWMDEWNAVSFRMNIIYIYEFIND